MAKTDRTHPRGDDPETIFAVTGVDRERLGPVRDDLRLVDALEDRLDAMPYPDPTGDGELTAADAIRSLMVYARATIVHWHRQLPPPRQED